MNIMFKKTFKYLLANFILLFAASQSFATHVVGGNLLYKCLGNDNYEITLEFAVDCINGDGAALALDSFATIKIFDGNNNLMSNLANDGELTIAFSEVIRLGDPNVACRVLENEVCVQRQIYVDTLNLPFNPDGYILSFRRCCRNSSLLNITDPLDNGVTHWTEINAEAQQICNNSAVFNQWPDVYVCINEDLVFDHSARDTDGDSLVYRLCAPSEGGSDSQNLSSLNYFPPFVDIQFDNGYDLNNLMGGVPLTIDAQTGVITATPNTIGQFLIGVCVDEYRNGVKISETRRDFEYNVRACTVPPISAFTPDTNPKCDGLEISFTNESISSIGNPLTFEWIFDHPVGSLISNEPNPVYTFPSPGLYNVALVTFDGVCQDTAFATIGVSTLDDPTVGFDYDALVCGGPIEVNLIDNTSTVQEITDYIWTVVTSTETLTFDTANPSFELTQNQSVTVTLEVVTESGCAGTVTRTLDIIADGIDLDIPNNLTVCAGESISFIDNIPDGIDVQISPATDIIISQGMITLTGSGTQVLGVYSYDITLSNQDCTISDVLELNVVESPLNPDIQGAIAYQCGSTNAILNPNGNPNYNYTWTSDDPNLVFDQNAVSPSVFVSQETNFQVEVANGDCIAIGNVTVQIVDGIIDTGLTDDTLFQCGENGQISLNPNGNPSYDYSWTSDDPNLTIIAPNAINPSVNVSQTTVFTVVVSDEFCSETFDVTVEIGPNTLDISDLPEQLFVCEGSSIELYPDADPNLTYVWIANDPNLNFDNNAPNPNVVINFPTEFSVVVSDGMCVTTGQLSVDLGAGPDAGLVNALVQCEGDTIGLNPNGNTNFMYNWATDNPDIDIDTDAVNPMVYVTATTTFTVTVTDPDNLNCMTESFVNVLFADGPNLDVNLDNIVELCSGEEVDGIATTNGTSIQWIDPNGEIIGLGGEATLSAETPGTYIVVATNLQGCTTMQSIEVIALDDAMLEIMSSTGSSIYCADDMVTLTGSGTAMDMISGFQWTDANGNILGTGEELTVSPTGDASYILSGVNQNGCPGSTTITLMESIIDVSIQGDEIACTNAQNVLSAISSQDNLTYEWQPANVIVGDNTTGTIVYSIDGDTDFTLVATNPEGCQETVVYSVTTLASPMVEASADPLEINIGQDAQLEVTTDEGWTYDWTPSIGLDDPTSPNPIFNTDEEGVYTFNVEVTSADGCTSTASVTITVRSGECTQDFIFVPNMFTPNGDNQNDNLEVYSNVITEMSLVIFDRWGEKITEMQLGESWNGTYEGKELPPDVYGYCINAVCVDGEEYTNAGNITLVR